MQNNNEDYAFPDFIEKAIHNNPFLSGKEERQLLKKICNRRKYHKEDVKKSIEKLICSNQKFLIKMVRNFLKTHPQLSFHELYAAGNEGLMIALKKFEIKRITKFKTYAEHWIIHSFHTVRKNLLSVASSSNPEKFTRVCSLDKIVDGTDDIELGNDILVDENEDFLDNMAVKEILDLISKTLTKKQYDLLKSYFIDQNRLEDVGNKYGISHEAVRLSIRKIIRKINRNSLLKSEGLTIIRHVPSRLRAIGKVRITHSK
jgi:RNA polymerase sigma factor (sigma-70 family)